MKDSNSARLRYFTSLGLLLAILISSSAIVLAAAEKTAPTGEIIVSGNNGAQPSVTLNGERVLSGQTFFSSGTVSTSETGSATINLRRLGQISLAPNSVLSLNFTDNDISGTLSSGQIRVMTREGVSVNIKTLDGLVNNDAKQAGVYTVDVQSGKTEAFSEQGAVYLNAGGTNIPQPSGAPQNSNKKYNIWIPVGILAGLITIAAIVTLTNDDDDTVASPVR
ncbi:MAG: hypothetical protein JSS81_23590 [Acidobacteria bacterium]|nr:hypothetical protein [Acidobacteriota bacterium]